MSAGGTVSFLYDYRITGRRETLMIGKYGPDGITLAEAREKLNEAKKMVDAVELPSVKERQGKCSVKNASRFSDYADLWFKQWGIAPSTMALHTATLKKHISPVYEKMVLKEITPTLLGEHCERIRDRGAPFTAVLIRDIVWKVFKFAQDRGYEGDNPVY